MRRFLIFILLGPLMAYVFVLLMLFLLTGNVEWNIVTFGVFLAFAIGMPPAALTALAGWFFSRKIPKLHVVATGVAGALLSGILLSLIFPGTRGLVMVLGLLGF